jgi:hypothetical protein
MIHEEQGIESGVVIRRFYELAQQKTKGAELIPEA